MEFDVKRFEALSSDGEHCLIGVVYVPRGEAVGLFHVVHGMTEHIARYGQLMEDMAARGYLCFGYDHLGHGHTARDASELGYIAKTRGWELLARDVKVFSDAVRRQYDPEGRLPYCLMGHSMGSFVVRLATERFLRPDRLIVMGTGGKNPAADAGLALIALTKRLRGDRYVSPLIDRMAFGGYNKRHTAELAEAPSPWLTRDVSVRSRYAEDPFCSFKFSVSAMGDLIRLVKYTNRAAWFRAVPKDLPILLISGADDPVGDYGRGVRQVEKRLRAVGADVRTVLYEGARHEILNDVTYDRTLAALAEFCEGAR